MIDRSSEASEPVLIKDKIKLAEKEAENALAQFDWAMAEVDRWLASGRPRFRVSTILDLHRIALQDIHAYAGNFRPAAVDIKGSSHVPIAHSDVPRYVEEMIVYLEENWNAKTAIHLASYVLWRLNWIHPFSDGNGRTSRILSYMVLCARLKIRLPGTNTIPEQIAGNKKPYYEALDRADESFKKGLVDVGQMEQLLEHLLANQLVDIHEKATGAADKIAVNASEENYVGKISKGKSIIHLIERHPVISGAITAVLVTIISLIFTR